MIAGRSDSVADLCLFDGNSGLRQKQGGNVFASEQTQLSAKVLMEFVMI